MPQMGIYVWLAGDWLLQFKQDNVKSNWSNLLTFMWLWLLYDIPGLYMTAHDIIVLYTS